jgi:hypothetical protein
MSGTIVKKACKCYKCKAELKVGDAAIWHKKVIGSNTTFANSSRFVRWEMQCADEKACGMRAGNAYLAKVAAEDQKKAQEIVDIMRSGAIGVIPQSAIEQVIAKYASEGIVVE